LEENEMKKLMLIVSVIIAASMLLAACQTATPTPAATEVTPVTTEAPAHTGAWVDEVDFTAIADPEPAVAQIQAGAIDIYPVTVDDAQVFASVKADPNLKYVTETGGFDQMMFNTVACTDTTVLNPFNDMQIREAMNWAVDRDFIVQEIMGGLAKPRYTLIDTYVPDYARYAATIGGIISKYAYNLDKAISVVDARMTALGATKDATTGKWMFSGKPVTIIDLVRTEDKRKDIGIYFDGQLEKMGFTVDEQLKTRAEAGPIWQEEKEALVTCNWNAYTAGWISTAISRDEGNMFAQYNMGDIQQLPLFYAYAPDDAYKAIMTKLQTNDFADMAERDALFVQALNDSMTQSWQGVMVVDTISFSPYSSKITVASDLAAGIGGTSLWPFTLQITGQTGGTVKIAQSGILVQPWNPVAGSNWIDDAMPQKGTEDGGVVFDPYTGLARPQRIESATLDAVTGLPIRKTLDWVTLNFVDSITVPGDAWCDWDAKTQTWITCATAHPEGLTAKTKSTVVYPSSLWTTKWHDGSPVTMGDFMLFMILQWDLAKPDSKVYDESLASGLEIFMSHFKGLKITSTDPLTIETYDDLYALDAENSISTWYPSGYVTNIYAFGTAAWHNMGLALLAEEAGETAFSTSKSGAANIEYLSMVSGPSMAILKAHLDTAQAQNYIPYAPTMGQYVTADEATTRYTNLQAWYAAHGHFWLGTGVFYLDKVFPVEGTLVLKRFADYIDPSDKWASLGTPAIAEATVEGPATVTIGQEAAFNATITFQGNPYKNSDLSSVTYIVKDATGAIPLSGDATAVSDGSYTITLSAADTQKLVAGSNTITVAVGSNLVALPTFVSVDFVTVAP
jgi:peptide/nickel transport system substrate-binding protein